MNNLYRFLVSTIVATAITVPIAYGLKLSNGHTELLGFMIGFICNCSLLRKN